MKVGVNHDGPSTLRSCYSMERYPFSSTDAFLNTEYFTIYKQQLTIRKYITEILILKYSVEINVKFSLSKSGYITMDRMFWDRVILCNDTCSVRQMSSWTLHFLRFTNNSWPSESILPKYWFIKYSVEINVKVHFRSRRISQWTAYFEIVLFYYATISLRQLTIRRYIIDILFFFLIFLIYLENTP